MRTSFKPHQSFRFARVLSGARIAWTCTGRPDAPMLVRVAHWLTNVEYDLQSPLWGPWVERLSHSFRLVRYDERGCGLSDADDQPQTLDAWMEELEAVISATGERKVALLGVSGGTPVAIAFAARYPERVSHLVLLGGSMMGALHRSTTPEDLGYLQAQWRLIETGWGRDDHEVLAFFSSRFLPEATPEVRSGMNEQQRRSCDATRAVAILKGRAALDARALAPKVVAPTLVLHCDRDRVTPVALGRDTAAVIPGARFEALNSGNHVPLGHEPAFARFCEAVVEFVIDSTHRDLLTTRERDLARLVAQGLDNAQIAATLGVANKTVRNALSVLYRKLGVDSRARAVARTRDMGF